MIHRSHLWVYPKEMKSLSQRDYQYSYVHCSIIPNSQCLEIMPVNGRMFKENVVYIYIMKYYSVMRKKEILPFSTTQMNLEGIMLSEIS